MNKQLLTLIIAVALVQFSCNNPTPVEAKKHFFPFTIELNSINPGQFDPGAGNWVQTTEGGSEVYFKYTLSNKINTIPGKMTAKMGNTTLLSSGTSPNTVPLLGPNTNFSGEFHTYKLPPGSYELYITYSTSRTLGPGGMKQYDSVIAQQLFYYVVPPDLVDNDFDKIDDREEKRLLDKYAPYFHFSNSGNSEEEYLPTDVLNYVRSANLVVYKHGLKTTQISNAELAQQPNKLFFSVNTTIPPFNTDLNYFVKDVPSGYYISPSDDGKKGSSWQECKTKRNIGLYGHVVPYNQSTGQKDVHDLRMPANKTFYKIEFWQFFGYNGGAAPHEADWTTVQLLYDPHPGQGEDTIVTVFHYAHGKEFRFDITPGTNVTTAGVIREYTGVNAGKDPTVDVNLHEAQNNTVRFRQDPETWMYTHPVVYLEHAAHEFYPTEKWKYSFAPNHDGGGTYQYFCAVPPNLGEVEHPLLEYEGARIILQFNGYWGSTNTGNKSGPGPTLHRQWTYPASSSIGWQLRDLPF